MTFFCRTVEARSFTAAAQLLDVVPSALSKLVAALESELGFSLMSRSTRKLSLTDEGAEYYEQCKRILADIEVAEGLGRQGGSQARGSLRVGMHPGLRFAVMTSMGAFLDAQPDVRVETVITNSAVAVVDDGLDLVLHIGPLTDSSLVARRIGWTRPVVCASAGYLAAWGEPRHPAELIRHRVVIYARRDEAPNTRWTFFKGNETCDVDVPVRTVMRDGIGVVDAVLGGCGVARPFAIALRHLTASAQLQPLLAPWSCERQPITAVFPPAGRSPSAKVRLFVEHIVPLLKPDA